jgi:hypothetical protein
MGALVLPYRVGRGRAGQTGSAGTGKAVGAGRGGRDRQGQLGQGKAVGAGRGVRDQARRPGRGGLAVGPVPAHPASEPVVVYTLEQLFAFYELASGECGQMVRYMSGGGRVHDDH